MSDAVVDERRAAVLAEWRGLLVAGGHPVCPSQDDLDRVAACLPAWPSGLSPATDAWRKTIEWLVKQADFAVADAAHNVPPRMRTPSATPPDASTPGPGVAPSTPAPTNDASSSAATPPPGGTAAPGLPEAESPFDDPAAKLLKVLRAWRAEQAARGVPDFTTLRDATLRQIARARSHSTEDVAKMLPPALKQRASELADVLTAVSTGSAGQPASAAPATDDASAPADSMSALPADASPAPGPVPAPQASAGPPLGAAPAADARSEARPAAPAVSGPVPPGLPAATEFAAFVIVAQAEPVAPVQSAIDGAGAVTLSWAPPQAADVCELYRVVADDNGVPYSPDFARLVELTRSWAVTDAEPFVTALRTYQVWRNHGPDRRTALARQPELYAQAKVVAPLTEMDVREDHGGVIGRWRAAPGIVRVHVYRIPAHLASRGALPEFRILAGDDNLGGFVDTEPEAGRRYVYSVSAEAVVDGTTRLSSAHQREVLVRATLEPVTDLAVTLHAEAPRFDLVWSPPRAGQVVVYRTSREPRPGSAKEALAASALVHTYLTDDDKLNYPVAAEVDGRVAMRDVPWPEGWARTYFTPVTVLEDRVYVGATTSALRVPPVGSPRVVERVQNETVTFEWPDGAAVVVAAIAPKGAEPPAEPRDGAVFEVSAQRYRSLGGLRLPNLLPARGCEIHLWAAAYENGQRVLSAPVSATYPGLIRLSYEASLRKNLLLRPQSLTVRLSTDDPEPLEPPPPMVLVSHPDRLPLDVSDGQPVPGVAELTPESEPSVRLVAPRLARGEASPAWTFDVRQVRGYVRLFADLPPARLRFVALRDPDASCLWVG